MSLSLSAAKQNGFMVWMLGRYDLIHQRLLLGAVSGGRWPQVIANLKKGLGALCPRSPLAFLPSPEGSSLPSTGRVSRLA